ncbi:class II aaRS and biotin synthetase [Aulographum hederae CBS 113979]|uniref:threonine--tRNA ligase n=1 Tax=Aulographum hederae CBS 113979 TaxID=1176131 RepID=A0A6G1GXL1_9PEZI|nr:class II aaRS and biotin synthetase [Aulographum hederae CBS 113979]
MLSVCLLPWRVCCHGLESLARAERLDRGTPRCARGRPWDSAQRVSSLAGFHWEIRHCFPCIRLHAHPRSLPRTPTGLGLSEASDDSSCAKTAVRCCSCTASRAADAPTTLNPTTNHPPKPPADHRELGIAQSLFFASKYSPGSPLLLPNGADMFNKLVAFLRAQYTQFGFREVITPNVYKRSLWETSGHWENYGEDMFQVRGRGPKRDEEIGAEHKYGLKPMNCPGHCLIFAQNTRSYRQLPIRYADFSALHRNEVSGSLSGLTRVRRFHQDDGHIFCRPIQVGEEIRKTLDFVQLVYNTFDLGPYKLVLSTRPKDHYIGTAEEWDRAENQLKIALDASGREWSLNEGDGAFYGPKIDIILADSDGKQHQTATIQLDFQLPQRFELNYIAQEGESSEIPPEGSNFVAPVMIHRAILGSLERFMALLIEHYDGVYPFWLAPRPAIILTVNDSPEVLEYAENLQQLLSTGGGPLADDHTSKPTTTGYTACDITAAQTHIHVEVDTSAQSLGKKIIAAKKKGYGFLLVVGPQDVEARTSGLEMHSKHCNTQQLKKEREVNV